MKWVALRNRPPSARTIDGLNRYALSWRSCANDEADDSLNAARGILVGIAGGALCWLALAALIAVGVWAIELLAGA